MKKLTVVLLSAFMLLSSGCNNATRKEQGTSRAVETEAVVSLDESAVETVRADVKTVTGGKFPGGQAIEELGAFKGSGYFLLSDGAYYVDAYSSAGRMSFADFASLNSFPVCSKPNCLHDDPGTCSAFGLSNGADVMLCSYGGSIYFVENIREMSAKGGISSCANIYKAAADGSERRKVATLEGYTLSGLFVSGDRGYTVAAEEISGENGLLAAEYNYFAESFDFKTNELKNLGQLSHLYTSDTVGVIGEYGGKIYYMSVGAEDCPEGLSAASPDYFDSLHALTVTRIFALDPETESITESELPVPGNREGMNWPAPDIVAAAEEFYVCQQGNTAVIASPDGSIRKIENHRLTERAADYPVNGMMFNAETLLATELMTGDIYRLRAGAIGENEAITAYYEGSYIVFDRFTREFRKLLPAELFEEE